eukprot:TRINITY_DN5530_c0_g1_i1.p1 TRINITY_DN5530_c0_g1~~TRINITY_DN5530_c0_g1_i1.p1  ORF type:complete len:324 (+),score=37.58 TRINITY_DN5530_c0_g1_i1:122-973(+)
MGVLRVLLASVICVTTVYPFHSSAWNETEELPWVLKGLEFINSTNRDFDYFTFALQWPETICKSTTYCCSFNACCRKAFNSQHFTIHGLWPEYNDGSWPQCCNGPAYDEKKIASLIGALERDWPSLSCNLPRDCHGKKGSFWEHEWEKHGTCSHPVIKDEYTYFSTALKLLPKYNILDILHDAGFSPNNDIAYPTQSIVTAISKAISGRPLLVCLHGSVTELRICLDKTFETRSCLGYSSCPDHVLIPWYHTSGGESQRTQGLVFPFFQLCREVLVWIEHLRR